MVQVDGNLFSEVLDFILSYKLEFFVSDILWKSYFTQLRVTAFDTAVQSQVAEALVSINMIRNENPPIFVNEPYTTTVPESLGLGSSVYKISATDADNVSYEFSSEL